MPRLYPAEGGEMSVLWAADQGHFGSEEALQAVRGVGVQDDSVGGGTTGAEEGAEDYGVCGLREAGVVRVLGSRRF